MGVMERPTGRGGGRAKRGGRPPFVAVYLLAGAWSVSFASPQESPEAKVGWVEREVTAAIEEFRRTDAASVLEERGGMAITGGVIHNGVARSGSARIRLMKSAIALWLEAWQARPYKDVVRDPEKSENFKEFFADMSLPAPERLARQDAIRKKGLRDAELRGACGRVEAEMGSLYGGVYGGFDGGAHTKEYMGEMERLWAGRPWFAVFWTNVVEHIEQAYAGKRARAAAVAKGSGERLGQPPRYRGATGEVARAEDAAGVRAGAGVRVNRGAEENARTASSQHGPTSVLTGALSAKRAGDGVGIGTACVAWASSVVIGYLVGRRAGSGRGGRDQ